jgi:isochorismate pyruvate lyase
MSKHWMLAALLLAAAAAARAEDADPNHPAYRGTPGAAGGTCCQNLGEVRKNLDRIDQQILVLMAERGSFVHEAGRFKANPQAVEDPHRVEQIIAKIRGLAGQNHLSPDVAEATYRAMIGAFTTEEKRAVAQESAPAK